METPGGIYRITLDVLIVFGILLEGTHISPFCAFLELLMMSVRTSDHHGVIRRGRAV